MYDSHGEHVPKFCKIDMTGTYVLLVLFLHTIANQLSIKQSEFSISPEKTVNYIINNSSSLFESTISFHNYYHSSNFFSTALKFYIVIWNFWKLSIPSVVGTDNFVICNRFFFCPRMHIDSNGVFIAAWVYEYLLYDIWFIECIW